MPLICVWVFTRCMFFFDEVVKWFECLKALYKFIIVIIVNILKLSS